MSKFICLLLVFVLAEPLRADEKLLKQLESGRIKPDLLAELSERGVLRSDGQVYLVFDRADPDKVTGSLITLHFWVVVREQFPLGKFESKLELVEGLSGRHLLRSDYRGAPEIKHAKFNQRRVPVRLRLNNADPDADAVESLTVKFYYWRMGQGRPELESNFTFPRLEVTGPEQSSDQKL